MKARGLTTSALISAAALLGLTGTALAAAPPDKPAAAPARSCFFSRDWDSWRAPDDHTIYFRVRMREFYRVDLSAGSPMLTDPANHLVSVMRGTDTVCSPLDLDLKVSDGRITVPLIAKSITKLTPEQVAAIPKKFLP
jgi:hypothetical protein